MLYILFVAGLAACSQAVPTPAPTLPPTSSPAFASPSATPTGIASATLAPTLGTPTPCTDSASLQADVTYPDNSPVEGGKTFHKVWRLVNTGTCTWNANYTLVFATGANMNGPASIPLQTTLPNGTVDVSVDLTAPTAPGSFTDVYQLNDPGGHPVLIDNYKYMWVKILVPSPLAAAAGAAPAAQVPVTGATPTGETSGSCTYTENPDLVAQLYTLINAARAQNGLPALTVNPKLVAAATGHSIDMACNSLLSHTGSDGSTITSRIAAAGYSNSYWNESIYAQPPQYGGDAQAAVTWWLNDPPHRLILLSSQAKEFGAGYADVTTSQLGGYFTIDFGAP